MTWAEALAGVSVISRWKEEVFSWHHSAKWYQGWSGHGYDWM